MIVDLELSFSVIRLVLTMIAILAVWILCVAHIAFK